VRADYKINADWKLLAQAGESDAHRIRTPARIANYNPQTGANGVVTVPKVTIDAINKFARLEAIGRFSTGAVDHALTVGVAETHRNTSTYDQNTVALATRQNIFDPVPLPDPVYTRPNTSLPYQSSQDRAVYGYDTISVLPQLKVLVGLRHTKQTEIVGSSEQVSNVNSPGAGVLWDLRPKTTLYASYLKGLEAGGVAPPSAANANVVLAPADSTQKEIGLRDSSIQGLNINVAYFVVDRANNITHPTTNVFGNYGTVNFKGVELGGGYAINRAWRVNGGLLWLKATQEAPGQIFNGKVPDNVPKLSGTMRITYNAAQWVQGLSLTAGGRFITQRPVDPLNQGYIPGFAVFDAGASYSTRLAGHRVTVLGSVDNLGNRRYWNAVFAQQLLPGMDRKLNLSAKVDF
jgi:iron complex outermembrane recepter protein